MTGKTMSEYQQILYSKEHRVATVTLNRPEKLNAYSEIMAHEILAALVSPSFGRVTSAGASDPRLSSRQIQFALRLVF